MVTGQSVNVESKRGRGREQCVTGTRWRHLFPAALIPLCVIDYELTEPFERFPIALDEYCGSAFVIRFQKAQIEVNGPFLHV